MKIYVIAVGAKMPDWVNVAWDDYAKRLPPEWTIALKEIKPEPRTTGKTVAQMMVAEAKPRWAIPCHFWTLAEQGAGDPAGFLHACARLCPQVGAKLLKPGEGLTIAARSREDQP